MRLAPFVEIVEGISLEHDGAFEIEVGKSRRKKQVAQNVESAPQVHAGAKRDLIERVVVSGLPMSIPQRSSMARLSANELG